MLSGGLMIKSVNNEIENRFVRDHLEREDLVEKKCLHETANKLSLLIFRETPRRHVSQLYRACRDFNFGILELFY